MSSLNLNEYEKGIIDDISVMSGYAPQMIREILEFQFLISLDSYMKKEPVRIPFIGKMLLKYDGDEFVQGNKRAKVNVFASPSDLMVRMIGDVEDGESELLDSLMKKKIAVELKKIINKEGDIKI